MPLKKLFFIIILFFSFSCTVLSKNVKDYYNSDDLSDYFGTMKACTKDKSENDCRNGNEYKFYLKLYDIYYLYKNKYNVKLDLPLIVSALYYRNEQLPTVYKNNLNTYNRADLKNKDIVTNLDWEYDFKNDSCYVYLNANDDSYDMQILAKGMVTKKITYECTGSGSSSSSGSSSAEVITDNSETGNGWGSVTTVKYDDGSTRTFRNYKQYDNGNDYWNKSYWDGNIWSDGCGPTAVSIILSGYGYNNNPANVVDTMNNNSLTYTSPSTLVSALKQYKIDAESHSCTNTQDTINAIRNNFKAGRPIMIGTHNHWVAYLGEDKNGMIISDPGQSDGNNYRFGKTLEDLVETASDGTYILIKSDGNASSKSTSSSSNSKSSSKSSSSKNSSKSSSSSSSGGKMTATDVETSNYDEQLKCDSGTLDKNSIKATYELDLEKYDEFLLEYIKYKYHTEGSSQKCEAGGGPSGSGTLSFSDSYTPTDETPSGVYALTSEPVPWLAINYWSFLDKNDFVYPIDDTTKLPLGAWPKNYSEIPTQLDNVKLYKGIYMWPATPTDNTYQYVYSHLGIDVMSDFGTPIYSPVDGTLVYSEWGGTVNKGSDETSYTVTITPNQTYDFNGTTISEIFMTHMSGIRYRCSWGQCNRTLKAGELIGFVGTAAGSSTSAGYASHVHITFYPAGNYSGGLYTESMEKIYEISPGTVRKAGE